MEKEENIDQDINTTDLTDGEKEPENQLNENQKNSDEKKEFSSEDKIKELEDKYMSILTEILLENNEIHKSLENVEKEINETSVTYSVLRIWALVCLIPLIIAWAKRLHDVGMSAWWLITIVVPLFVSFIRGDSASNRYGEYSSNERMFAKLWGAFSAFEKSFSGMGLFISKQITFSFKEILYDSSEGFRAEQNCNEANAWEKLSLRYA